MNFKNCCLLLFIALHLNLSAQCNIQSNYNDFIKINKIEYDSESFLMTQVVPVHQNKCFSDYVNKNIGFFDFLLTHYSSASRINELLEIRDSTALQSKYIQNLEKDSVFNAIIIEFQAKAINKSIKKDTINENNLLNIAVKYFSILNLQDDSYVGKVCVGLNLLESTEPKRQPFIEAFCFASILKHYSSDEFSMYNEFVKAIKQLYNLNLGIDKDERILRAQGAVFFLMHQNENLRKMLESEYQRNIDYLPFVVN